MTLLVCPAGSLASMPKPVVVFLQTKFVAPHVKCGKNVTCDWKAYYVLEFDDKGDRIYLTIKQPLSQPELPETFQQEVDKWLGPFAKELRIELTAETGFAGLAAVHDVAAEDVLVLTAGNLPPAPSLMEKLRAEISRPYTAPQIPLQRIDDNATVHKAMWSPETIGCSVEVSSWDGGPSSPQRLPRGTTRLQSFKALPADHGAFGSLGRREISHTFSWQEDTGEPFTIRCQFSTKYATLEHQPSILNPGKPYKYEEHLLRSCPVHLTFYKGRRGERRRVEAWDQGIVPKQVVYAPPSKGKPLGTLYKRLLYYCNSESCTTL